MREIRTVFIRVNENQHTVGDLQYMAVQLAEVLKILDNEDDLEPVNVLAQVRGQLRFIKNEKEND